MSMSVYRTLAGVSLLALINFVMLVTFWATGDANTPTWPVALAGVGVGVSAIGLWVLRPTLYTREEVAQLIAENLPTMGWIPEDDEDLWVPDDEEAFENAFPHLTAYDEDVPF